MHMGVWTARAAANACLHNPVTRVRATARDVHVSACVVWLKGEMKARCTLPGARKQAHAVHSIVTTKKHGACGQWSKHGTCSHDDRRAQGVLIFYSSRPAMPCLSHYSCVMNRPTCLMCETWMQKNVGRHGTCAPWGSVPPPPRTRVDAKACAGASPSRVRDRVRAVACRRCRHQ